MTEHLIPVAINHAECQAVVNKLQGVRQLLLDERDQLLVEVDRLRTELRIRDETIARLQTALRLVDEALL